MDRWCQTSVKYLFNILYFLCTTNLRIKSYIHVTGWSLFNLFYQSPGPQKVIFITVDFYSPLSSKCYSYADSDDHSFNLQNIIKKSVCIVVNYYYLRYSIG